MQLEDLLRLPRLLKLFTNGIETGDMTRIAYTGTTTTIVSPWLCGWPVAKNYTKPRRKEHKRVLLYSGTTLGGSQKPRVVFISRHQTSGAAAVFISACTPDYSPIVAPV